MRIDNITLEEVKQHLRLDTDEDDFYLYSLLEASKQFILSQTGLTQEYANTKEDLGIACLCVIADMYENRGMSNLVSRDRLQLNPIYESIIGQYSVNLL